MKKLKIKYSLTNKMSDNQKSIEKKYQSKSPREHILDRPSNYIGQMEKTEETEEFVIVDGVMRPKTISYSPAFIKIFDEILTNAIDHSIREKEVSEIRVWIDQVDGFLKVYNNGPGIEVQKHPQTGTYIPEFIFGQVYTSSNYDDSQERDWAGVNGIGSKCISPDTQVPLFEGGYKLAKNIKIGDKLIGDDGRERTVLNKISGNGKMFEISQVYGEKYTVNSEHTLTLHMPDHKVIFWNDNGWSMLWWDNQARKIKTKFIKVLSKQNKCEECNLVLASSLKRHYSRQHKNVSQPRKDRKSPSHPDLTDTEVSRAFEEIKTFSDTIDDNNIIDIEIKEYLSLSKTTQKRLAGLRSKCVQWEYSPVELDPYILGLWLGDGMKCGYRYACDGKNDPELIKYFEEWCSKNDAIIKEAKGRYTYSITSDSNYGKKYCAPLRGLLKKYNLVNNKHIPLEYIKNSREVRLKVLAGLIDTDGHVSRDGSRIIISQSHKHKELVDNIVFLVRSLGFCCSLNFRDVQYKLENGEKRETQAYFVNISGNLEDIPTLLSRGNPFSKNMITTGQIKIQELENGDYIGLQIDGNQRFAINDFTVTHNCSSIMSKRFTVETLDAKTGLFYTQEFKNNLSEKTEPVIKAKKGKPFTQITFYPDFKRFGMKKLEEDALLALQRRVYQAGATLRPGVKLYLDDKLVAVNDLQSYASLFNLQVLDKAYLDTNKTWELITCMSPDNNFHQASFINGIPTVLGGKHIEYVSNQIVKKCKDALKSKYKDLEISPSQIKNTLFLFLRAKVANPSFNSQTKDYLTSAYSLFSSNVDVPDKSITNIVKAVGEYLASLAREKEETKLNKQTDTRHKKTLRIPKLDDAHWAGTAKSNLCSLILTEGDSAKTCVISGISSDKRDYIGVFPLRGKGLNIQRATKAQLEKNEEVLNIMKILGLQKGIKYKTLENLRYGQVYLVSDQDFDGFHIKGLLINFFRSWFPELLQLGYLKTIKTPIVKVFEKGKGKNKKELSFYNLSDFEKWKREPSFNFEAKYKKGLGSLTKDDAKSCFSDLVLTELKYTFDKKALESIDLPFAKVNHRKDWLATYDATDNLDYNQKEVSFTDFIHKELKHFSAYDNLRSIPHIMDGLKPSQRKILFSCFKKNLTSNPIRVSQLAGYVSEQSEYHHGEASLQETIIGMAQDFVGSNNINLLFPEDQFGSRLLAGQDAGSPRYIHTCLTKEAVRIFPSEDFAILRYLKGDEGDTIEPDYYYPILPMILVNGSKGIGSGYSTDIPSYNPQDLIQLLRDLILKRPLTKKLVPWFKNFKGKVVLSDDGKKYYTHGVWKQTSSNKILITELPIKKWTESYREVLNVLEEKGVLRSYKDKSTDSEVYFELTFRDADELTKLIKENVLENQLDLVNSFSLTNMNLFVPVSEGVNEIKTFKTPEEILKFYFNHRLAFYSKRKNHILDNLKEDLKYIEEKMRFIQYYLDGKLEIEDTDEDVIISQMLKFKFVKMNDTYNYLLDMPIRTLSKTRLDKLEKQMTDLKSQVKYFTDTKSEKIWDDELSKI